MSKNNLKPSTEKYPINTRTKGVTAETQAQHYLEDHGLLMLTRNYRCHHGEIDLIMQDKDTLVFVEVRSRVPKESGLAIETIDARKIHKIINTAEHYLQSAEIDPRQFCRFDIVTIDRINESSMLNWHPNAFQAGDI